MNSTEVDAVEEVITEEELEKVSIDDFIKIGPHCYLILIFAEFILLAAAGNMMYMMYAGAAPYSVPCVGKNFTIPDICAPEYSNASLEDCEIQPKYDFKSVNVEFKLFCKNGQLVKSSVSYQMMGVMFGTLLTGQLSDRFGRIKIVHVCMIIVTAISYATTFTTNLFEFTLIRTLLGIFNGGLIGTYGVYKMEHIPRQHRFWVATIISWAPNFILLATIAWLVPEWKNFQIALIIVSSPAFILAFFVRESPRWLVQRGRIEEARVIMNRMLKMDGASEKKKRLMNVMLDFERKKQHSQGGKSYNVLKLFSNRGMSIAISVMCLGRFFTSLINYGLIFNIEKISGSLFVNALITGFLRWTINIIFAALDFKLKIFGRKAVHFGAQFCIAICMFSMAVSYLLDVDNQLANIIRIATVIASAVTSQVFVVKGIVTMEFFPTLVRNSALALESTSSRIGTILAPQVFALSDIKFIPYILLTIMSLTDAILFQLTLPETKGSKLPETLPTKKSKQNQKNALIEQNLQDQPLVLSDKSEKTGH